MSTNVRVNECIFDWGKLLRMPLNLNMRVNTYVVIVFNEFVVNSNGCKRYCQ